MTSCAEGQRKHGLSEFIEAAKAQLLSGERRIYEYFLCKVGERLRTRKPLEHPLQSPLLSYHRPSLFAALSLGIAQ